MLPQSLSEWNALVTAAVANNQPLPSFSLADLAQISRNMSVDVEGATGLTLLYSGQLNGIGAFEHANSLADQYPGTVRIVDRTDAVQLLKDPVFVAAVQAQVPGGTKEAREAFIWGTRADPVHCDRKGFPDAVEM